MTKQGPEAHGGYITDRPADVGMLLMLGSSAAVGLLCYSAVGITVGLLAAYLSGDIGNAVLGFFVGLPAGVLGFAWNYLSFRRLRRL